MDDEAKEFWFNTQTKTVEDGKQTAALFRIGPFATREEASRALETIEQRTQAWQREEEDRD
ncbi:MAG: SPOR domain-containing protein [Rhodoluna sp.]|nr:SPOR domain-containing protein [Rhodoluna sp.]